MADAEIVSIGSVSGLRDGDGLSFHIDPRGAPVIVMTESWEPLQLALSAEQLGEVVALVTRLYRTCVMRNSTELPRPPQDAGGLP